MFEILTNEVIDLLKQGMPASIAIILENVGSMPRHGGAHLLYSPKLGFVGTVGGGNVEHLVSQELIDILKAPERGRLISYTPQITHMVCGGAATIAIIRIDEEVREVLLALAKERVLGQDSCLVLDVSDPKKPLLSCKKPDGNKDSLQFDRASGIYTEPLWDMRRVYIFGAGHVGSALSPLLPALDFLPIVIDDRKDFAAAARFPEAKAVVCAPYTEALEELQRQGIAPRARDFAVILTKGHKGDIDVLYSLSRLGLAYVGCIGSKTKRTHVAGVLRAKSAPPDFFEQVHLPIGARIGAITPAEIAISIAAELIEVRKNLTN